MPRASIVYVAVAEPPGWIVCSISTHTSVWSSRGVHDNGCGRFTTPSLRLNATTFSDAVLPEGIVSECGANHVSAAAPNCFSGVGAMVGAGAVCSGEATTGDPA